MKNKKVENAITAILAAAVLITGGMSLYSYLSEQKAKSEYDAIRQEVVVEEPKVEDLLRHMDQVLEMGGEDCLAIGSDFDGCSGRFPEGIKGVQSVPDLRRALLAHGFGESLVEKIFHENDFPCRGVHVFACLYFTVIFWGFFDFFLHMSQKNR